MAAGVEAVDDRLSREPAAGKVGHEPVQAAQQGRFSASGGPQHNDDLSAPDFEIKSIKRADFYLA